MNIITATNYKGNLHIGYGNENSVSKRLGDSIETYRGFISKFFSKLFGISMLVEVDGKTRCVKIESLRKHLESIGCQGNCVNEVKRIGYHAFIRSQSITAGHENLGENFSDQKRMKLFGKMLKQLEVNNANAVKRFIRKGAYVDREFFKPLNGALNGQSFWYHRSYIERALHRFYLQTDFCSYTPLVLAAEKGNQSLAKFIAKAKNNDMSSDKKQTIHYTVTRRDCQTHWKTETTKIEHASINDGNIVISAN